MSKYAELLGLLQEDIEKIVEKRMQDRVADIIETLMPSILEHVANHLNIYQGPVDGGQYHPELNKLQLVMTFGNGSVQYIGAPFNTIDVGHYNNKQLQRTNDANAFDYRISQLESKANESKN